jgi:stage IV sporulation protein B
VGGESIGINIQSNGLEVTGYYKIKGKYINKNIKVGDKIIKIDNTYVDSISSLTKIINEKLIDNKVNIEIIRNGNNIKTELIVIEEGNKLKTGLYIKDSIVGLGTLTYIDPESMIFGSLGHEISFSETNNRVEVKDGRIMDSNITNITKSHNGSVGSKNARIFFDNILGRIKSNTKEGLYGFYLDSIDNKKLYEIETFENIKIAPAYILTVTDNNIVKKYNIDIIDKFYSKKDTNKAFSFRITDDELINKTGGIVQGMSGSPIIQNNKIIGSVTNVVIDNVKVGYGISIITMLKQGDKIRN